MHRIDKRTTSASGQWLYLEDIEYSDREGVSRHWEAAMRTGGRGAVAIIATLIPSERIVLVRQFRPPTAGYVIEFPAGLIDEGETPAGTAIRELYEETGYRCKITEEKTPSFSSPGMTGESIVFILAEIDETAAENINVTPHLDDGEDIETFIVEKHKLISFLKEREEVGDLIDAKVVSYAAGVRVKHTN